VEYEIGMGRCGASTEAEVCALARQIKEAPGLSFDGVQAYAGHLSHTVSYEERKEESEKNAQKLRSLLAALAEAGTPVNVLSGGSTGTCQIKAAEGLYTELQAGSYLFMDATYDCLGLPFKPSLFILATVVSVSNRIAVVDAGVKSCGVDQGMPIPVGFTVSEVVASEEHFQLHAPSKELAVGEKVLLIPAHCCSTVNLHNHIYLIEKERVVDRITVTARGYFH
jgi:3-hydroxy-D-aspartate aldolase